MGTVPEGRLERIEFYEAHLGPWSTNVAALGLTPAELTELSDRVNDARAAYNAAIVARDAARAATTDYYDKVRFMHNAPGGGADVIREIKNYAISTNNPNVYVLAQIPPPATPSATPPPGTPFDFTVGLNPDGSIKLRWKCNNPAGVSGTIYEVQRRIGSGTGAFSFIGATGVKNFTDATLINGSQPVTYQITGVRSTSRGTAAQFTVNFGIGGGGGFAITGITDENTSVKLAA